MDSNERPAFGDLLRRARRQAGLTQELLAERAGISVRAITDLERGVNRAPRVDTLELLADALELSAAARAEWERLRRRSTVRTTTVRGPLVAPVPAIPSSARLPVSLDALIGRERELADVRTLLAGARLVTLLGPGGIGKTRLALEVAHLARNEFADGAAFVDLAPVRDAVAVLPAIATALGVKESADQTLRGALFAALGEKRLLLVLDNLEQVVGSAGDISELLLACRNLTILATSRVPLHIQGEQRYPVPELGMPDVESATDLERLLQSEAVTLFSRRAQGIQPSFRVTSDNAPAIAAICVRLDGLPLAIELAAARSSMLTPAAILDRLDHRLRLLTGGARDAAQRQRTLRDTIAWSYELLTDAERQLFRWLAVFSGGWTLVAAEAIAQDGEGTTLVVLDSLSALVEHSVVRRDERISGEPRFGMLETIREFAIEQLATSGDEAGVRLRHVAYTIDLAETFAPLLEGPDQLAALERLEREHDNFRAALDWCVATPDAERGLRLAGALWHFWERHGHLTEGRWQFERLLALPDDGVPPAVRAMALTGAGVLSEAQTADERAEQLAEQALAIWYDLPLHEQHAASQSLLTLSMIAARRGDIPLAASLCGDAWDHAKAVDNRRGMRLARFYLSAVLGNSGDLTACLPIAEEAYVLSKEAGDLWLLATTSHSLGTIKQITGSYDDAQPLLEEGLALHHRMGDKTRAVVYALSNLGWNALQRDDIATGMAYLSEALALSRELGGDIEPALILCELGEAARLNGDLEHALQCFREGLQRALTTQFLPSFAAHLEPLATLFIDLGEPERALRLLAMADALRASSSQTRLPDAQRDVDRDLALLRELLTEIAFNAAWEAGHAASLDEIIQEISHI